MGLSRSPSCESPNLTTLQASRQLAAMRAEVFELVLLDFGPARAGSMRTLTYARILASFSWLRAQNAQGLNINIRPKSSHLTLIDDLSERHVAEMWNTGYEPCVVVETSPGNHQAWIDHGRELEGREATEAAKLLAARFEGDRGAAGKRHSGRLAGFTNRKQKHQLTTGLFPFVHLRHAEARTFSQSQAFDAELVAALSNTARMQRTLAPQALQVQRKTLEEFHADARYQGDLSRADYAYCIYAHAHSIDEQTMLDALLRRDMSHKGDTRAQRKYALHTIARARRHV